MYRLRVLCRLGQYFFIRFSVDLRVTVKTGIATIERFHSFFTFKGTSAIPYGR